MKTLLIGTLTFGLALGALGQSEEMCFKADFLQGDRTVRFKSDGAKVAGVFSVQNSDDPHAVDGVREYPFTGTRTGNSLKVVFKGGKLPDVSPSEMKALDWKLATKTDKEVLRIQFRGKNYDTNKYEDSVVEFESCEPGYAQLAKTAKRLAAVGADGRGKQSVSFAAEDQHKALTIAVPKGKSVGITSAGLGIKFYYPNEKPDPEGGIDTFSTDKLTEGGDCLLVLKRINTEGTPEPAEFEVEYTITDERL